MHYNGVRAICCPIVVLIICIGNLLHGNDGVGHAVFARLNKMGLPASVELLDGGIGGLALLPHFKGVPRLLIIDLMKSDMQAGSISFFEDIASHHLIHSLNIINIH